MPLHVSDQIPPAFAPVITGDFVVQIAKTAFDGIGTRAVGGQKQQHEARMLPKPALDRRGLVDLAIVGNNKDPMKVSGRVSTVKDVQKVQKQSRHFPKPETVM